VTEKDDVVGLQSDQSDLSDQRDRSYRSDRSDDGDGGVIFTSFRRSQFKDAVVMHSFGSC